jgi:hypothetical protein
MNKKGPASNSATGSSATNGGGSKSDTDNAKRVATQYAALLERVAHSGTAPSIDELKPILCADLITEVQREWASTTPTKDTPAPAVKIAVKDVSVSGNQGKATLTATGTGTPNDDASFDMVKETGQWKVCRSSGSSGSSSSPSTTRSG